MNDGSVCKKWHFVGFSRIKILKNNEQVYLSVCERENIFYCRILASVISAASWNLTITCWRIKMKWQNRTCVVKYVCECASQSVITCQKVSYHMWKSIQNECFRIDWFFFVFLFWEPMSRTWCLITFVLDYFLGVWEYRKHEIFVAFYHQQTKARENVGDRRELIRSKSYEIQSQNHVVQCWYWYFFFYEQ